VNRTCKAALATVTTAMVVAVVFIAHQPRISAPPRVAANVAQPNEVESINDEQLLALFPNRPVALIGPPGDQRLVIGVANPR
jgi:hypothetical protein